MDWAIYSALLLGVVASMIVLILVLRFCGLSDGAQALGLPQGSVRALLALSLVILFAVMSTDFVGDRMSVMEFPGAQEVSVEKVPATDLVKLVAVTKSGAGVESRTVKIVDTVQRAEQTDLRNQLLTVVGTVLSTVIAFYFGTRTSSVTHESRTTSGAVRTEPSERDATDRASKLEKQAKADIERLVRIHGQALSVAKSASAGSDEVAATERAKSITRSLQTAKAYLATFQTVIAQVRERESKKDREATEKLLAEAEGLAVAIRDEMEAVQRSR